jgi:hypothetical protein
MEMPIDERWQRLTPAQWDDLARAWLAEIRASAAAPDSVEPEESDESSAGGVVTMMNFTADPEQQWQFIQTAMAQAATDDELGAIAAGPVEHLLGWHGPAYIEQIERWAAIDTKAARMVTGVWKYMMSDDLWMRVRAIQARVAHPLSAYQPDLPEHPTTL